MAKNVLKAWPVDNTVTTDDKADKIFSLETTHSIDKGNHTGSHGGKESWRAVRDDGEYTLTVTTQYRGGGGDLLKTPRSTSHTIYIGKAVAPPRNRAAVTEILMTLRWTKKHSSYRQKI